MPALVTRPVAKAMSGGTERRPGLLGDPALHRALVTTCVVIILVSILVTVLVPRRVDLQEGQPAKIDIQASRDIINRPATDRLREEAAREAIKEANASPANYDISLAASINAEDTIDLIFDALAEERRKIGIWQQGDGQGAAERILAAASSGLKERAQRDFGTKLSAETITTLMGLSHEDFSRARTSAKAIAGRIMRELRVSRETLDTATKQASDNVAALGLPGAVTKALTQIVTSQISPNLVLNPGKVERAREAAVREVKPVMILKGQAIIRRGEIATGDHIAILQDLGLLAPRFEPLIVTAIVMLVVILVSVIGVYLYLHRRDILLDAKLLLLLGTVVVMIAFAAAVICAIPWPGAGFLVPVSLGTMLIAILLDPKLSALTAAVFGVLTGIVGGGSLALAITATLSGLAGTFCVTRISERSDLMRAGAVVGAANAIIIAAVGPTTGDPAVLRLWYLGIVNGVLSTVVTIGFLPFFENLFRITTPVKLLELSNPTQTLLRKLLVEAPGTYHHSIIVGNLAEAAAEAVGADSLLVRVGAYYHDVGKMKRPYFFVENQLMQDNPHDKLAPTLSTLVITSHVKDGVEMALRHNLPQAIVDIIKEHHGTSLVPYFYHKATEGGKEETIDEEDFRYPGPKPQTKEAAIVMLADSVEAAVRSLARPTPGRIEGLVRKIIKERLADGQFDECNLTLKDLDGVARAFVRVLTGVFHSRIEYPDVTLKDLEAKRA
ncbi:MAG: HDIG domain-containing metalloprotein [Bacillota bacterium]